MEAEIATYAGELRWILEEICASLDGLTPAELDWRPATPASNSAAAIASHVLGSTRVYALGFGCGRPVERDRAAEFAASSAGAGEILARLRRLSGEIQTALARLGPGTLAERLVPPGQLWGTGEPREISRREALVESIRHAAIHLGELRLTRDLARRAS